MKEKNICELKDKSVEIFQTKLQRREKLKKNINLLRDLWCSSRTGLRKSR
jgi:hypothetical protein